MPVVNFTIHVVRSYLLPCLLVFTRIRHGMRVGLCVISNADTDRIYFRAEPNVKLGLHMLSE